jgi:hypothetical protein
VHPLHARRQVTGAAELLLASCVLQGNAAREGGAVYASSSFLERSMLVLAVNSSFSANTASHSTTTSPPAGPVPSGAAANAPMPASSVPPSRGGDRGGPPAAAAAAGLGGALHAAGVWVLVVASSFQANEADVGGAIHYDRGACLPPVRACMQPHVILVCVCPPAREEPGAPPVSLSRVMLPSHAGSSGLLHPSTRPESLVQVLGEGTCSQEILEMLHARQPRFLGPFPTCRRSACGLGSRPLLPARPPPPHLLAPSHADMPPAPSRLILVDLPARPLPPAQEVSLRSWLTQASLLWLPQLYTSGRLLYPSALTALANASDNCPRLALLSISAGGSVWMWASVGASQRGSGRLKVGG